MAGAAARAAQPGTASVRGGPAQLGNPPARDPLVHCVRPGLEAASRRLRRKDIPVPALDGKLLRPLVAWALVPPAARGGLDGRFWAGALAVQMAHEASLLHDDVVDAAASRRGRPSVVEDRGVGVALILGDHYLTAAYRAAAAAGDGDFLAAFIHAVERTVAGERAQGGQTGVRLTPSAYQAAVEGKSGALFGAAAALAATVSGSASSKELTSIGRRLGAMYQRVDDLLDFCPAADTGKPPLQDYRQRKWTWILDLAGLSDFSAPEDELLRRLFTPDASGQSPVQAAVSHLSLERQLILSTTGELAPGDRVVGGVLDGWVDAAVRGVAMQEAALAGLASGGRPSGGRDHGRTARVRSGGGPTHSGLAAAVPSVEAEVVALARAVGGPDAWPEYFRAHARTFQFAGRLFPGPEAARVAGVYAWCRFTDDLVDDPPAPVSAERLTARWVCWAELTRAAYHGHATGVALLDEVMGSAAEAGVPWLYPGALLDGVRMDLESVRFDGWDDLERYTFRVASAVGGWITCLFGIRDGDVLERAHALGHGMQLTNILRDVGEDARAGRCYLPTSLLRTAGVSVEELVAVAGKAGKVTSAAPDGTLLPPNWPSAMELLMARADAAYERAWPGIRALPGWYRRPVAVAAEAYRGIHARVRANGYDNLHLRAHTSLGRKAALGVRGLVRAR